MNDFVLDFLGYVRDRKKLLLLPLIATLLMLGALLVMAQGSVVAPFIYSLF